MSVQEEYSDDVALAGEYALHLLDDAARRDFENRMSVEPELRDLVRDWDDQLALLTQQIAPVTPPAAVKARLQSTLFPDTSPRRNPFWSWVSGAVLAAGIAVAAIIFVPFLTSDSVPVPSLTASVAAEDGSLVVNASFSAQTNTLAVSREVGGALPGRVLELWLIAEGADAPVSLGVLPAEAEARIEVPQSIAEQLADGVLAISDEPTGGSPTGAPTGAVLAVGQVTDV